MRWCLGNLSGLNPAGHPMSHLHFSPDESNALGLACRSRRTLANRLCDLSHGEVLLLLGILEAVREGVPDRDRVSVEELARVWADALGDATASVRRVLQRRVEQEGID